jgi:hypothetical protein
MSGICKLFRRSYFSLARQRKEAGARRALKARKTLQIVRMRAPANRNM